MQKEQRAMLLLTLSDELAVEISDRPRNLIGPAAYLVQQQQHDVFYPETSQPLLGHAP